MWIGWQHQRGQLLELRRRRRGGGWAFWREACEFACCTLLVSTCSMHVGIGGGYGLGKGKGWPTRGARTTSVTPVASHNPAQHPGAATCVLTGAATAVCCSGLCTCEPHRERRQVKALAFRQRSARASPQRVTRRGHGHELGSVDSQNVLRHVTTLHPHDAHKHAQPPALRLLAAAAAGPNTPSSISRRRRRARGAWGRPPA
jgi:hypothetical protein